MQTVRRAVLVAGLLSCLVVAVVGQGARATAVVFEGARIIDGSGGTPIENGALLVQDGRIAAVGPVMSGEGKACR